MDDLYFDAVHADNFLSLMLGGIARAEERHRAKLRTVDEHGNLVEDKRLIEAKASQGGDAT